MDDKLHERFGGNLKTTNNRMELTAAIKALKHFDKMGGRGEEVTIISDSQYVIRGASVHMFGWKQKGMLKIRSNLKNRDLWTECDEVAKLFKTRWLWVRGHNGHRENERCDHLAKLGRLRALDIESSLVLQTT
jgi:ribonuclease HI